METDIDPASAGQEELRLLVGDVIECEFGFMTKYMLHTHDMHSGQNTSQNTPFQC